MAGQSGFIERSKKRTILIILENEQVRGIFTFVYIRNIVDSSIIS